MKMSQVANCWGQGNLDSGVLAPITHGAGGPRIGEGASRIEKLGRGQDKLATPSTREGESRSAATGEVIPWGQEEQSRDPG
jgi:hypothetical protein